MLLVGSSSVLQDIMEASLIPALQDASQFRGCQECAWSPLISRLLEDNPLVL